MAERRERIVRRSVGAGVALALLAGVLALTPAPAAGTTGGPQLGVVADLSWGISRAQMDRSVAQLREAGVRWARVNVSWSGGEPDGKGRYNEGWLADIDHAVRTARAAGIEVLMPISDGVPHWASADPRKTASSWDKMWQPRSMADYGDFVRYVAARYRPLGVRAFEIWNEPNHPRFWPSGPNPAAYVPMLKAGHAAVKSVDPGATVVLGGLSKNDATYLAGIYANGGRAYFDVAAVHPYTGSVSPTRCWNDASGKPALDAFCSLRNVRDVMVANGDTAKPIWLTEFGWSTSTGSYGVDEATQARHLTEAVAELRTRYPYVTHALWYMSRDIYWSADPASWDGNAGLVRRDFSPKPSLAAFRTAAGAAPVSAPSITTTTTAPAPTTTTTAPPKSKVRRVRIAGKDRVTTAVALSAQTTERADTVVIARADVYADALAAAPLAAKHRTSILLTGSSHLAAAAAQEVARLGATEAIIVGGTSAVGQDVTDGLRRAGVGRVRRIAGVNRFDTARLIALEVGGRSVVLAEGANRDPARGWPDAVAASSMAAAIGQPILLVESTRLPVETARALAELGATDVTVVGGTAAVSEAVLAALRPLRTTRIAGADRFATSVLVAEAARQRGATLASAWVATGRDWPDALSAGPVVAASKAVLVLVDGTDARRSAATADWFAQQAGSLEELVVVGGFSSVSEPVELALLDRLG